MNIANLSTEEQTALYAHKRQCLINHYRAMTRTRANDVLDRLNKANTVEFKKRINACKREIFIK